VEGFRLPLKDNLPSRVVDTSRGEAFSAKSRFVANFDDKKMLRPYILGNPAT